MIDRFAGTESFVAITLDSCRWDTFAAAATPNLHAAFNFRLANAQGTYTLPAHVSMYSGIFPDVRERVPYYNRFAKNLFRIAGRPAKVDSLIEFPRGTPSIFQGLADIGYRTLCVAALEWFRHPTMRVPFQRVEVTGIHLAQQLQHVRHFVRDGGPLAMLLNIGETHDPYEFGGHIPNSLESRARMRAFSDIGFVKEDFEKQVAACEFIDRQLGDFLDVIPRYLGRTIVVVCGDHGECFGEDGCYGHGFHHPKVAAVPLAIGVLE